MPVIQFDVLVPNAQAERVAEIFTTATDKLVESGSLSSADVTRPEAPQFPEGLEAVSYTHLTLPTKRIV